MIWKLTNWEFPRHIPLFVAIRKTKYIKQGDKGSDDKGDKGSDATSIATNPRSP